VFTAGRRENVVIADSLIFPNHQVSIFILCVCTADERQGGGDSHASKVIFVGRLVCPLSPRERGEKIDQGSSASKSAARQSWYECLGEQFMQSRVSGSHVFRLVPVVWFREIVHSKVAISLAHLSLKPRGCGRPKRRCAWLQHRDSVLESPDF